MVLIYFAFWSSSLWFGLVLSEFEDAWLCDFSHKQEYGDDWARIDGKFENPVFLRLAVGSHGILCAMHGRPYHREINNVHKCRCIPDRAYSRIADS